jgi:hypothetical protein
MSKISWINDADAALEQGKNRKKPILLDFTAAPM